MPPDQPWDQAPAAPHSGLQLWPLWGPLPAWLPAGSVLLGLADALAGALAGAALAFVVRLAFLRGALYPAALSGDVGLCLLGGAFFGWQPILSAVLFTTAAALLMSLLTGRPRRSLDWLLRGLLAPGLLLGSIGWPWLGAALYPFLFAPAGLLGALALLALLALPLALLGGRPAQTNSSNRAATS
jgi:leader peptidase (prepilin peptidase)/N-methyltransferase